MNFLNSTKLAPCSKLEKGYGVVCRMVFCVVGLVGRERGFAVFLAGFVGMRRVRDSLEGQAIQDVDRVECR